MSGSGSSSLFRFLGVAADADAMELLGLSPAACVPAKIEAALERQLDRVDQHPQADTPEADDARLALHAAAAQLLDPDVRRELVERAILRDEPRVETPQPFALVAARSPIRQLDDVFADSSTRSDAEPIKAQQTADGSFRSSDLLREEFASVREVPENRVNSDGGRLLIGVGLLACACMVLIGILLIVISPGRTVPVAGSGAAGASASPATPASGVTPPPTTTAIVPSLGVASAGSDQHTSGDFVDPTLVVRQLQAAVVSARGYPAAGMRAFEAAIPALADWWCRFDRPQRVAAESAVIDLVYLLGEDKSLAEQISKVFTERAAPLATDPSKPLITPREIWSSVWAAGMMQRLSSQSELGRGQAAALSGKLIELFGSEFAAVGPTYENGARVALIRLILPISSAHPSETPGDSSATNDRAIRLKRWTEALTAIAPTPTESEQTLVEGLERLLIKGAEPSTDMGISEAVEYLASRLKWRADSMSRERLISWFADPRVSDDDLATVTRAIATKSGAENVQPDMVLTVSGATPDDRAKLRSRYAQAWGLLKTEVVQGALKTWADALASALSGSPPMSDLERMSQLVQATRLNEAARRIWLGDPAQASAIIGSLPGLRQALSDSTSATPPASPLPGQGPGSPATPSLQPRPSPAPGKRALPGNSSKPIEPTNLTGRDGDWALAYLRAEQNIPLRLERLSALQGWSGAMGPIDAAVLMEAACFGSPVQVRMSAQSQVQRFVDEAPVVQAALEILPAAPKIWSVGECFSAVAKAKLPKVGDPDWELVTRRALVERLLAMVATRGESSAIQIGEGLVAESYKRMAGAESGPVGEGNADLVLRSASSLYALWRMEADRLPPPVKPPFSLEQIQRRRDGRLRIASGPTQAFAAEQAAVAEMLAYVICAERPLEQTGVTAIITRCADKRRRAGNVLSQLGEAELAIAELWRIRLRALDAGAVLGSAATTSNTPAAAGDPGVVREVVR